VGCEVVVKFISMDLYNFMSFKHANISFREGGYVLVQGVNESNDDHSLSNGSGKSSLWEAITWCLTGDTIRGSKDVSNLYTEDGACVSLDFSVNEDYYSVRRSRDHSIYKTNLYISVNGEDKSGKGIREGDAILSSLLPDITPDLIGSVIILGQGLPCRLSSRTPAGRKELLEKLTKSDFMIEDIKERISKRKEYLSSSLRSVEDTILKISVEKNYCSSDLEKNKKELGELSTIDSYADEKGMLSRKLHDLCDKYVEIQKEYDIQYEELQNCQNQKSVINSDWYKERESSSKELSYKIEDTRNRVSELKSELLSLNREKSRIESIKDVCPTCGQKIPGVYKPSTDELSKSIDSVSDKIKNEEDILADQKNTLDRGLKDIDDRYSYKLSSVDDRISGLQSLVVSLDAERQGVSEEISLLKVRISGLDAKIDEYSERKKRIEESISLCEKKLEELNTQELYYNNEKQNLQDHLDVVSKMVTLANRDFRGYLLSNVVEYIDGVTKEYSSRVFGSPCVSFSLNGNSLNIKLFDKYYESLSGGEKQKVDLIVQFALRKMLCNTADFSSNIIVLDEIFDNMDEVSSKQIIDFISEELNDLETVFIITHHSDLQIPYDNIIKVVKDNSRISRIV